MKFKSTRRFWAIVLTLCLMLSLMPFHFELEVEAVSGVNSLTCSSFISNSLHQKYIDTMMKYYINTYSKLQTALNNGLSVVFMFEGGSDYYETYPYVDAAYSVRMQAVCIVVQKNSSGNAQIVFYSEACSSIPDDANWCTGAAYSGSTTILDGIYNMYTCNHNGSYAAFTTDCYTGWYSPYVGSTGWSNGCSGINIHTRNVNWAAGASVGWANSAGCQLIGYGASDDNSFNQFMKLVAGISWNSYSTYKNTFSAVGYNKGYYVVDRQLGLMTPDGTAYGSGSLADLYTKGDLNGITSFSTTARANSGFALDYEDQCTFYESYCKIKVVSDGAPINTRPCSVSTTYDSETIETASVGDTFTATGLYKNLYGNYWYRIKTSSGKTGYIYGGEVEYIDDIISDVTISNYEVPNGLVAGSTYYINGTIKTTYNKLSSVACNIYPGFGTDVEATTGGTDTPTSKTYTLKGSAVDNATWMGKLETGNYTYQITATYTNYYSVGATTLKSNSDTVTLVEEYFAVIPSSADQSACSHTNTEHVLQESTCLTNGSSVTVCSTCGKITKNVTSGGHSYGGWTTTQQPDCDTTGIKTRTCSACGHVDSASIDANGHSYTSKTFSATCQEYERIEYTCSICGDHYSVFADDLMSDWLETKPEGVADNLLETKTQYRYSDYETTTSYSTTMAGYTQIGKEWIKSSTSTLYYVSAWDSGYDTTHSLYSKYNKTPVTASETETAKTTVDSGKTIAGYVYYHWCYGTYTAGPINRSTSKTKTDTYNSFHSFYADVSTQDPTTLTAASDGSVTYAHADGCTDSWWWYYIPVYKQTSTTYKAQYTFERWTDYSAWSDTVVTASDTRKVETRTLYRYVDAQLGDHSWDNGVCSVCDKVCEHSYVDGYCSVCGVKELCRDYYLFGFINNADYGCEADYVTIGEYKFVDGSLTVRFTHDSYVAVKTSDNTRWYMTDGWQGFDVTSVTLYHNSTITYGDKLFVPGNCDVVFTLVDNGNDTFTLSYVIKEPVKPTLTLKYPALEFESEILYNIYYSATDLDDVVEMGLVTFSDRLTNGTINDAVDVIPGYVAGASVYRVQSNGIPAKKLGDMLYFKVYAKLTDGTYVYSDVAGYSAVLFAKTVLNSSSTSASLKSLMVSMLNYGAAAQQKFSHNTDNLMNAFLTDEHKAYVDDFSSGMISSLPYVSSTKAGAFVQADGSYTSIYPSVAFDSAFAINYYFVPGHSVDGNLKFYYWTLEDFNAVTTLTVNNATGSFAAEATGNGVYRAKITGIAAKEIDKTIVVAAVYESNGVQYASRVIPYSLGKYCGQLSSTQTGLTQELAEYTAVYGFYAKQYFGSV